MRACSPRIPPVSCFLTDSTRPLAPVSRIEATQMKTNAWLRNSLLSLFESELLQTKGLKLDRLSVSISSLKEARLLITNARIDVLYSWLKDLSLVANQRAVSNCLQGNAVFYSKSAIALEKARMVACS